MEVIVAAMIHSAHKSQQVIGAICVNEQWVLSERVLFKEGGKPPCGQPYPICPLPIARLAGHVGKQIVEIAVESLLAVVGNVDAVTSIDPENVVPQADGI